MDFDWKKLLGTVAPTLATAMGGPLAGLAVKTIGDALGITDQMPATEENISARLKDASAADLLALKKADQEFLVKMKELEVDLEKAFLSDKDSARKREMAVQDNAVPRIAALVVIGFIVMSGLVLTGNLKVDSVLAGTVIGYVASACTQVLSYYFGTSKSSSDKNALIAQNKPK
jgi:xanthine/uracil permease